MTDDALRFEPTDPRTEALLHRALRLLEHRGRSVGELRQRLREDRDLPEELIEDTLAKLLDWGYLDDDAFATAYTRSRIGYKAMGRQRIVHELRRRRVPGEVIDRAVETAFEDQDEAELLARAVRKWLRTRPAPADPKERKRLTDFLVRRGFPYPLIAQHLTRILASAAQGDDDEDASLDDDDT